MKKKIITIVVFVIIRYVYVISMISGLDLLIRKNPGRYLTIIKT